MNDEISTAAQYWSVKRETDRTRWWHHERIHRHINRIVCGKELDQPHGGFNERIRRVMPAEGFRQAVSIGCGTGGKEMRLLRAGIVQHFDLCEIGEHRREQINRKAADFGVTDRVTIHIGDAFQSSFEEPFDLVYWNNALHHMIDVDHAVEWSHRVLSPGGWFVMDDFVGASRFQWSDEDLQTASRVRELLPERFLLSPRPGAGPLSRQLTRPSIDAMLRTDPSEAADSARILPSLKRVFPGAQILLTGGVVYHLALSDVLTNFDDEQDVPLLDALLLLDDELARMGRTHYAVALASKS
ncbi:class I SAM-dependent methyltransferase [Rhizorhabdus dicambivorans]|uniref:Class I SAM-dependent methyltransferase n=1 Tax=Rhizorhabdus dicambivorans TaxID=1850238 RepID=A0A2A4G023_9SPHN|nr:class I SAM-dependent methyltransferase [Rhizorhabdus dicambivorans]ATE64798.1 class I SAM-dependent methyltransferase [Rhizorhabdus dicambivorans]PCE44075.1 class I SAM-dependent methyltransferase [Rhizorhabdus dicambivorans]